MTEKRVMAVLDAGNRTLATEEATAAKAGRPDLKQLKALVARHPTAARASITRPGMPPDWFLVEDGVPEFICRGSAPPIPERITH